MKNNIVMIEIERLHPHPKNPRKNIGDVSELAESIKKSGVLQNLTVVPRVSELTGECEEGQYTVVIGHRRRAAAESAGLTELPCVVKEMTAAEQLATMLAENVQRNDLTPIEQAEGIQMMFDIGESVMDIVHKTGLSESTVRRRAKLLEFDIEKLRATEGRGATLADYERLNQIEDVEKRNEILESIGTNNFDMNIKAALTEQQEAKNKKTLLEILDTFAKKVTSYPANATYVKSWNYNSSEIKVNAPKDADTEEYFYYPNSYGVALYKKDRRKRRSKEEIEKDREQQARKAAEDERRNKVRALAKSAYELRKKFIKEFNPAPRHGKEIKRLLWNMLVFGDCRVYCSSIDKFCGTDFSSMETYERLGSAADEYLENNFEKAMLEAAYLLSGDYEGKYIYGWNGEWCKSQVTDKLYECLERLGYQMSDAEKELADGTHELFKKE